MTDAGRRHSLAARSKILNWRTPVTDRMTTDEMVSSLRAMKDAPLEWLAAAKIEKLRTALDQITRQPIMPLSDPIAHSWEAFGRRANYALRDCRNIANAALKE